MPPNLVGQILAHYRILEQLGAGGMGVVYKAQDLTLGRNVALKLLPAAASNDRDAVERFRREARTASALNHPNICTIYSFVEHEGQFLLAMELLDGEPLDKRINGKPLDARSVIDIAMQIADALDAAHSEGVLHRDIKPPNIYITRRGPVKVLDFGLAKLAPGPHDMHVTQHFSSVTGTTVGTVSYMSPEQARGEALDPRTDLFSFGVVLYEMATGRQGFQGATTAVIFDGILNREPPPPRSINARIPGELDHIIRKALEKDRMLRYQTAADMRADLARLKRDSGSRGLSAAQPQAISPERPVESPVEQPTVVATPTPAADTPPTPATTPTAARKFSTTTIAALVIGGIAVLALLGALAGTLLTSRHDEPVASVAPTPAAPAAAPAPTTSVPSAQPQPQPPATGTAKTTKAAPAAVAKADPKVPPPVPAVTAPPDRSGSNSTESNASQRLDIAQAKIANGLFDQALVDLRQLVNDYPTTEAAAEATFLSAGLLERLNRMDDAMAAHVEFNRRYGTDRRVPDSKLRLADLILKSKRADKESAARALLGEVARDYPRSPQAMNALQTKIRLEMERRNVREMDPALGVAMPAVVMTMRTLTEQFPDSPAAMLALTRLAEIYEDANQYPFAAQALTDLGTRFPTRALDAWYRLGELYERRLKDPERARQAYEKVPPASPRYRDAQRKLKR